jgi:hypothetical protein
LRTSPAANGGVPKPIVAVTFLCIGEHGVRLSGLLKFFFRAFIAFVPIGMVL